MESAEQSSSTPVASVAPVAAAATEDAFEQAEQAVIAAAAAAAPSASTTSADVSLAHNTDVPVFSSWDDLDLDPLLLRGIYAYGFERPSPIQQRAIRPLMEKRDLAAQAQSGTGKTATFTIGALSRVDTTKAETQVIVLSPTKELTLQTAEVFQRIGSMVPHLRVEAVYGGREFLPEESISSWRHQRDTATGGSSSSSSSGGGDGSAVTASTTASNTSTTPHVVCGCPGKVFDLLRRKQIQAQHVRLVVMDEADDLLSEGFKEQIYVILQKLNSNVQIALFSATYQPATEGIVQHLLRNPVRITVEREMLTLEGIKQYYVAMEDDEDKYCTLKDLFSHFSVSQCIIYSNTVERVEKLYRSMKTDGFPVSRIHSRMTREEREASFLEFKSGGSRVLISSDLTARGIDIQQVSTVINFDVPKSVDTYLHRIGRSGRWGRKGVGINFVTRRDIGLVKNIEKHYSTQISELPAELSFLAR